MKKLIICLLSACCATQAFAQQDQLFYLNPENVSEKVKTFVIENDSYTQWVDSVKYTEKSRFMFNGFFDNWFLSGGAAAQIYFGEQDYKGALNKRILPLYEVGLGKWIHPAVGVRALFQWGDARGFADYAGAPFTTEGPDSKGLYTQQWSQVMTHVDIMLDLNNAIGGYKPTRFYTLVPYVGAGVYWVTGLGGGTTDRTATFVAGLQNRFRLSNAFDLSIDLRMNTVDGDFDHETFARPKFQGFVSAGASLSWKIGRAGQRTFIRPGFTTAYITRNYKPEAKVTVVKETVVEEKIVEKPSAAYYANLSMAIFFDLNKAVVTERGKVNVAYAAEMINKSEGVRFRIVGMADSHTGNDKINLDLSQRRAEAVRRMLVEQYGVSTDKLVPEALGGVAYKNPSYVNRAVLIIPEK